MDNLILILSFITGVGKQSINYFIDNIQKYPTNEQEIIEAFIGLNKNNKKIIVPTLDNIKEAIKIKNNVLELSKLHDIKIVEKIDNNYPKMLENIKNSPSILFYKGNYNAVTNKKSITIVGTRNASEIAKDRAFEVARYFAKQGYTVISGLALGCDEYAHKGTLSVNGKTVAVLASGLNQIYPAQNSELAKDIISKGGCLLSEYPVGTKCFKYNFVERDRIQSGLSKATLVIETHLNSGTMHTVKYAKEQERIVACCDIDTDGNNMLIQDNKCITIYNDSDIITLVDKMNKYKHSNNNQIKFDI